MQGVVLTENSNILDCHAASRSAVLTSMADRSLKINGWRADRARESGCVRLSRCEILNEAQRACAAASDSAALVSSLPRTHFRI